MEIIKTIGFIGTGVIGASMARHLIHHGYSVRVYNRTPSKAEALRQDGAIVCSTIEECVKEADVVMTIVGYPNDVLEVYNELFQWAKPGTIAIDMTTSSPTLAKDLYNIGVVKQVSLLDAPVSGGDVGAKNATLTIMVGGDKQIVDCCLPLFECLGKTIVYCGEAGSGQHTKMANQIAIAGAIGGVSEALLYSQAMNLDLQTTLNAISNGAAGSWQMQYNGPKMIQGDDSAGFYVKHFIKDMKIALECAQEKGIQLDVLQQVCSTYDSADSSYNDKGTQVLFDILKKR